MQIGAHVSSSGGLPKAVGRATDIGAEAIQIFVSAPQMWSFKDPPEEAVEGYRGAAIEASIGSTWLHGVYLTNLGAEDPAKLEKGVLSLTNYMRTAHRLGAAGVIFHPGSHKGVGLNGVFSQAIGAMTVVLEHSPEGPYLCLENSAGAGNSIGRNLEELAILMKGVGSDRVRVCLDTCHLFAAGYDIRTTDGLDRLFDEVDRTIGAENLVVIHANDSKKPLGSHLDRHENIGEGHIGEAGWEAILTHPRLQHLPFLLEVPGYEGQGPDARNVATMKRLAGVA